MLTTYGQIIFDRLTLPLMPTIEGERRYASADATRAGYFDGKPCVCTSLCRDDCRGECGCQACKALDAADRRKYPSQDA